MRFAPSDKYQNHLPMALPLLYVCAECSKELVCVPSRKNRDIIVQCSKDARHVGFRSRKPNQADLSAQQEDAVRNTKEVFEIAKDNAVVAELARSHQEKIKRDLFGE
jgi:DNA-directed RNA polymerase subunit RPC12/RpoP